jgi:hypothetical protein
MLQYETTRDNSVQQATVVTHDRLGYYTRQRTISSDEDKPVVQVHTPSVVEEIRHNRSYSFLDAIESR